MKVNRGNRGEGRRKKKKNVLVGVLKCEKDLRILREELWYRVPVEFLPTRAFKYIALYQPACFGKKGKCIRYYARIEGREVAKRIDLLPKENGHPRAQDEYMKFTFGKIEELGKPIRNIVPRRISFGFTDLKTLRSAKDILELYGVAPTEVIVARRLKRLGIDVVKEYTVTDEGKRYRIDLAIFSTHGNIAIECDNTKAHSSKLQKSKDRFKDSALISLGWQVFRLKETDILDSLDTLVANIQKSTFS
ncbi:MAG TPA: DUF559 domain-containing protein [Candidatus Paceibacterota bacterium]